MRRSAWIFFASIFLPSLGLAWLAIHSARDQQVVLEHQQAIICQNITDALAKNIQSQMDQVRGEFDATTQHLLVDAASPQTLAQNFNRKLRDAWPMAEIGFAVNLDGTIYSPQPYDGDAARTFRDENDRFLSNRENVEVYSSNSAALTQNASSTQNDVEQLFLHAQHDSLQIAQDKARMEQINAHRRVELAEKDLLENTEATSRGANAKTSAAGSVAQLPTVDQRSPTSFATNVDLNFPMSAAKSAASTFTDSSSSADTSVNTASPPAATADEAPAPPATPLGGTMAPTTTTTAAPSSHLDTLTATMPAPAASPSPTGGADLLNNNAVNSTANAFFGKIQRQVIPQQTLTRNTASISNTLPEESDFRRVIGTQSSGELARFLEDKMRLLVWSHATPDAPIVFGAQLDPSKLIEQLKGSLQIPELAPDSFSRSSESATCVAILDDTGQPVALSRTDFKGDWKHPFVATEISEVLPHWEAALYLVDPQQFSRAARTLQLTFGLIVLLLVGAIVSGGSLIAADVRRQVRLAQQKTDFVSNVSHELKTPLTSIRMFADLLAEKRVPDEERQATYLRIIAAEASRLTRLINNVLDFARLERGAPAGEPHNCDLVEAVRDVVETCGPHLEAEGIAFHCEIEAETLPIRGDRDALAQIILNLISNAEKYGGQDILVRVRRQETTDGALGCVDVLDRGAGIPPREAKTIFEPFHRLDDSLSSGIPGSGLGLTLARRMARAHSGDVTYSARAGGGSCFTLTVPLGSPGTTTSISHASHENQNPRR